jgi:alpha-glucosidase
MLAGPMDYTPGSMANANLRSFAIDFYRPMSLGTRAHEVAKYVVYESPLQMLCDTPSRYLQELETTRFITQIPSVWDQTIAIDGKVGDYILVARRSGDTWFVGAMTDGDARELELPLSFLDGGKHTAEIFRDGRNAQNIAIDFEHVEESVTSEDTLIIEMAPGGGWSAIIRR